MAPVSTAPPSLQSSSDPDPASDDDELHKLHLNSHSTATSHTSTPDSRPVDLRSPIPEEDEEKDETASEAANEPRTSPDPHHPPAFQHKTEAAMHDAPAIPTQPSLALNTSATPPPSVGNDKTVADTPKTPVQKNSTIGRVVSGLFRRSHSQSVNGNLQYLSSTEQSSSDPSLSKEHHRLSFRRKSATNSPTTTRSNTPPSPASPTETYEKQSRAHLQIREPARDDLFSRRRKNRTPTGFSLRDRLHKVGFPPSERHRTPERLRHRSTSVDLEGIPQEGRSNDSEFPEIQRQVWGILADAGTGVKSRRISLSLPDDFAVDVVELYSEYVDHSKMIGRRGKMVGRGATAHVRLMNRRGGSKDETYAVKEFRPNFITESAADYEKKIKSEYSIAKSVHHPNIVETQRLCTHNGKWNQVMEYCEEGDLFSHVEQKYLSRSDHQVDRLCLFKQLVQGINYLHSNGIAHRDIKLENCLLTKDSKLKITDFGISEVFAGIHPGLRSAGGQCGKDMQEVRLCASGICGSPPYVAPEVVAKKGEYDPRPLDVWGAGIVMLCMCANGCLWEKAVPGSSPVYDELVRGWEKWNAKHADDPAAIITEYDYPHVAFFDKHIHPPALRRLLLTMLNPDPARRVTIAEVVKNRWLKNVECCQIDSYDDPTTVIDASRSTNGSKMTKVVQHNHLPPTTHVGHKLVRLPGSTDMR